MGNILQQANSADPDHMLQIVTLELWIRVSIVKLLNKEENYIAPDKGKQLGILFSNLFLGLIGYFKF